MKDYQTQNRKEWLHPQGSVILFLIGAGMLYLFIRAIMTLPTALELYLK